MKQTRNFVITIALLVAIQVSFATVEVTLAQPFPSAQNAQGDLAGENWGNQIVFNWADHNGTSEYVVYRSTSIDGPWEELARVRESAARTGGSKVDVTPDASLMQLCYRVEALDANGNIIRSYEGICVPTSVEG